MLELKDLRAYRKHQAVHMGHDPATTKRWTAAELRRLSPQERDAILAAQAAMAEPVYRDDAELTAFDAFGPRDLHGESSNTQTRRTVAD